MSSQPDHRLHGKDPAAEPGVNGSYPLLCHLLDTAVVAEILWRDRVRPRLRTRIAEALGANEEFAGRLLALVAALHDVGKLNPYFQFQERAGASSGYAVDLKSAVGLPATPPVLRHRLNSDPTHPLRRHEFISHHAMAGHWADSNDSIRGSGWLGTIAGGHHGYWRDPMINSCWVGEAEGDQLLGGWTAQQSSLVGAVEGILGVQLRQVLPLDGDHAAAAFVGFSGLLTVADWLASDDLQVTRGKELWARCSGGLDDPYLSVHGGRAWMDARHPGLLGHLAGALGSPAVSTRAGLTQAVLGDFRPRPLQAEALSFSAAPAPGDEAVSDPGLWICMYPTGDGKTEAALLRGAVSPDEGLFFGMPTLATTDAMEGRLAEIAQRLPVGEGLPIVKSHQFADLMKSGHEPPRRTNDDDDLCDHSNPTWYTTSIRKLVAPNVVGTVDQALVGALAQRHITLRLFGLANHHIVLDEVHTYDEYQTQLVVELLYWWGLTDTRVTLLSATLPAEHMKRMVQAYSAGVRADPYAGGRESADAIVAQFPATISVSRDDGTVTVAQPRGPVREPLPTCIDLDLQPDRAARVAAHIDWARRTVKAHKDSPVAIVSNVVADCTTIAAALRADPVVSATHEVLCLHSSLVAGHRAANEMSLLRLAGRGAHQAGIGADGTKPVIVVGTQLIQASLDFDVDFMATDLAPAPDILQRLGRAWRFEGTLGAHFRGGRLPEGTQRTLRVVSVVGDDDAPTVEGTRPYLTAVLRRTHEALRRRLTEHGQLVDIFAFSQAWVDHAYNADPAALLSEDLREQRDATGELVVVTQMQSAALESKAALARSDVHGACPLLPKPAGRGRGPRWSDLVATTHRDLDEDLMRTRYVIHESFSVILMDSTGKSFYVDPASGQRVQFPRTTAERMGYLTTSEALLYYARFRAVVSPSMDAKAREAVTKTLAGREWAPAARLLLSTPPLDLRYLADIHYDPVAGLTTAAVGTGER